MKDFFYTGRSKYNNLSIVRVADELARGNALPAEVQADVDSFANDVAFQKALKAEINRIKGNIEYAEACAKYPKLERMVWNRGGDRRNWQKLLKFC